MSSGKAEIHQLACAPFHIFGGCAVIEDYERVGALKQPAHEFQPNFHLVLLAYYHKHSWVIFTNSVVGLVVRECWADKRNVVELATERAVDLVDHLFRFVGPTIRALKGILLGSISISTAQILIAFLLYSSARR